MIYGIIYEYVDIFTGLSAYIGKSSSLYGMKGALRAAHRRHLRGHDPVPFDFLLRDDSKRFSLSILDELTAPTSPLMQQILKPLEKERVRSHRPTYNCVRFVS